MIRTFSLLILFQYFYAVCLSGMAISIVKLMNQLKLSFPILPPPPAKKTAFPFLAIRHT